MAEAAAGAAGRSAAPRLVLASASQSRRMLLRNAGVEVAHDVAAVDEDEVKRALQAERASAAQVAEALAELKALRVSARAPGALVIGADQTLDCQGQRFDKPSDLAHAGGHLRALRGKSHVLNSAVCVVRDGTRLWHHVGEARLTMWDFDDAFIDGYLAAVGDKALSSVGAYQLEGLGAQLFSRVEGDYFTILGLPLLPLLDFLRNHAVIPS